jgi:hypothetical protein
MYWFGQSRRERNDFIALVKLGISLDVLVEGGQEWGIKELTKALFGKEESDIISTEKYTLKQVVDRLYKDGRSKIAHGGSLALLRELPLELGLADSFTANVLANYVVHATRHTGRDTYEEFLAAIPGLRASYLAAGSSQ